VNITAIYYLQSVLQSGKALIISLGRGLFISGALAIVLPMLTGENGLWLALPIAEAIVFMMSAVMFRSRQTEE